MRFSNSGKSIFLFGKKTIPQGVVKAQKTPPSLWCIPGSAARQQKKEPQGGAQPYKLLFLLNGLFTGMPQTLNTTSPSADYSPTKFKVMKKITIGLFSLFALSTGGAAVLSAIPSTVIAAPMPRFLKWLQNVCDGLKEIIQIIGDLYDSFPIGNKPGQNIKNTEVDLTSLINSRDLIADFPEEGFSLSTSMLKLSKDVVIVNNDKRVIVLKAGSYRINQSGKSMLKFDIFVPSPTFPYPPGSVVE